AITVWYSVPFALIQLSLRGKLESRDLGRLRWVLFAGEPFPTKHLKLLMAQLPQARYSNLYGPTETNVCTYYHVPDLDPDDETPIPIGIPCDNVEAVVVDSDGAPVQDGEAGELFIRGGVVMRGYWGQPEKTSQGFFHRTVLGDFPDIFYRTGDLVQRRSDGNLVYLGRQDRQIKTRGYRVELDEVEVSLLAHEGVEEAAVYCVPGADGSNLIEAAVILKSAGTWTADDLIGFLGDRLPGYAIPTRLTISDQFPRTSTGKIDRRKIANLA
ncbi:MAG: AMP-binding protein, partial [Anaerolineales bacterium]